ncbi:MAG: PspC domain-containing protein [Nocardioides sp.]
MTETQTPPDGPTASGQPSEQGPPPTGVATDKLRDYEQLRRSLTDRKIAGVAGGLGRHLNIDPTVLRVLLVVLVFFGGAGIVLYGVAWLVVPEERTENAVVRTNPATRNALLIVAAVVAALLLLGDTWGGWGGAFPWPIAIVGLIALIVIATRDKSGTDPSAGPATFPLASGPGQYGWIATADDAPAGHPTTTSATTPTGEAATTPLSGPPSWKVPPATYPPTRPRTDRGPKLFGFTLAFIAVALGTLGLFDAAGVEVADAAYAALALTVVAVMLVVGSVAGRPGGLIFLGIVATVALVVTATVERYGYAYDRADSFSVSPASAATLDDDYSMLAGRMDVDLTTVEDLENLDGRTLTVRAEAGDVFVFVPDGLDIRVDAEIGIGGEIDVDGQREEGRNPGLVTVIDGGDDVPGLTLVIDLRVGSIDVRQVKEATAS